MSKLTSHISTSNLTAATASTPASASITPGHLSAALSSTTSNIAPGPSNASIGGTASSISAPNPSLATTAPAVLSATSVAPLSNHNIASGPSTARSASTSSKLAPSISPHSALAALPSLPSSTSLPMLDRRYICNHNGLVIGVHYFAPQSVQAMVLEYIDAFVLAVLGYTSQWYYALAALHLDPTCVMANLLSCDFFTAMEDIPAALQCLQRVKLLLQPSIDGPAIAPPQLEKIPFYDQQTPAPHVFLPAVTQQLAVDYQRSSYTLPISAYDPYTNTWHDSQEFLHPRTTVTRREVLYYFAYNTWLNGDIAQSLEYWLNIVYLYPHDLLALKRAQLLAFFVGNQPVLLHAPLLPAVRANIYSKKRAFWRIAYPLSHASLTQGSGPRSIFSHTYGGLPARFKQLKNDQTTSSDSTGQTDSIIVPSSHNNSSPNAFPPQVQDLRNRYPSLFASQHELTLWSTTLDALFRQLLPIPWRLPRSARTIDLDDGSDDKQHQKSSSRRSRRRVSIATPTASSSAASVNPVQPANIISSLQPENDALITSPLPSQQTTTTTSTTHQTQTTKQQHKTATTGVAAVATSKRPPLSHNASTQRQITRYYPGQLHNPFASPTVNPAVSLEKPISASLYSVFASTTQTGMYLGMLSFALEQSGLYLQALQAGFLGTVVSLVHHDIYRVIVTRQQLTALKMSAATTQQASTANTTTPSAAAGAAAATALHPEPAYSLVLRAMTPSVDFALPPLADSLTDVPSTTPKQQWQILPHRRLLYDPWSHHGMYHALFSLNQHRLALSLGLSLVHQYERCMSFMFTHNWFHIALMTTALEQFNSSLLIIDAILWKFEIQDQLAMSHTRTQELGRDKSILPMTSTGQSRMTSLSRLQLPAVNAETNHLAPILAATSVQNEAQQIENQSEDQWFYIGPGQLSVNPQETTINASSIHFSSPCAPSLVSPTGILSKSAQQRVESDSTYHSNDDHAQQQQQQQQKLPAGFYLHIPPVSHRVVPSSHYLDDVTAPTNDHQQQKPQPASPTSPLSAYAGSSLFDLFHYHCQFSNWSTWSLLRILGYQHVLDPSSVQTPNTKSVPSLHDTDAHCGDVDDNDQYYNINDEHPVYDGEKHLTASGGIFAHPSIASLLPDDTENGTLADSQQQESQRARRPRRRRSELDNERLAALTHSNDEISPDIYIYHGPRTIGVLTASLQDIERQTTQNMLQQQQQQQAATNHHHPINHKNVIVAHNGVGTATATAVSKQNPLYSSAATVNNQAPQSLLSQFPQQIALQHIHKCLTPFAWRRYDVNYPIMIQQEYFHRLAMLKRQLVCANPGLIDVGQSTTTSTTPADDLSSQLQLEHKANGDNALTETITKAAVNAGSLQPHAQPHTIQQSHNNHDQTENLTQSELTTAIATHYDPQTYDMEHYNTLRHAMPLMNKNNTQDQTNMIGICWKMELRACSVLGCIVQYDNTSFSPRTTTTAEAALSKPILIAVEPVTGTIRPLATSSLSSLPSLSSSLPQSVHDMGISLLPHQTTSEIRTTSKLLFPAISALNTRWESILSRLNVNNSHQDPFFDILVSYTLARCGQIDLLKRYAQEIRTTVQAISHIPRREQLQIAFIPVINAIEAFSQFDYNTAADELLSAFVTFTIVNDVSQSSSKGTNVHKTHDNEITPENEKAVPDGVITAASENTLPTSVTATVATAVTNSTSRSQGTTRRRVHTQKVTLTQALSHYWLSEATWLSRRVLLQFFPYVIVINIFMEQMSRDKQSNSMLLSSIQQQEQQQQQQETNNAKISPSPTAHHPSSDSYTDLIRSSYAIQQHTPYVLSPYRELLHVQQYLYAVANKSSQQQQQKQDQTTLRSLHTRLIENTNTTTTTSSSTSSTSSTSAAASTISQVASALTNTSGLEFDPSVMIHPSSFITSLEDSYLTDIDTFSFPSRFSAVSATTIPTTSTGGVAATKQSTQSQQQQQQQQQHPQQQQRSSKFQVSLRLENFPPLGGSNEQRDVIVDFLCTVLLLARRYEELYQVVEARMRDDKRDDVWFYRLKAQAMYEWMLQLRYDAQQRQLIGKQVLLQQGAKL